MEVVGEKTGGVAASIIILTLQPITQTTWNMKQWIRRYIDSYKGNDRRWLAEATNVECIHGHICWRGSKLPDRGRRQRPRKINWDIVLFDDDNKFQRSTKGTLEKSLDPSTACAITNMMVWNTPKYVLLEVKEGSSAAPFTLVGNLTKTAAAPKYLSMNITRYGVTVDSTLGCLDSAIKKTQIMSALGLHDGSDNGATMIRV